MLNRLLKILFGHDLYAGKNSHDRLLGDMWMILGFKDPQLLNEITYQKEAMMTLVARAVRARRLCRKRFKNLDDDKLPYEYREARNSYTEDVMVLRRVHPIFAELPLHWSELPGFIRKWQKTTSSTMGQPIVETMKLLETS